ncbi:putative pectate lyase [Aureobasidium pullulans]|nr:putative pectate lyase [Aureobasidium pullulans]THY12591.1 putative pectate lyase [Aureobasidium pullulans]THZ17838.1 putative pectate lyase [Aureobasidium pullulans]TIA22081.1 putative pectate lyase [Aureobasidium pullulans]
MKFTPSFALAALTSLAVAAPHDIVNKRAVASGPVGYASTNGGTTGGQGGATTTVSTLAQFTKAATAKEPTVVYISGKITGNDKVRVSSDTSIIGLNSDSALENIGLFVNKVENVILRNFKSGKVLAKNGDAIGIQASKNVWADHLDLSSDLDHGKDYYDGLLDVTHASEWVTISNVFFHDHYKCSLVGHSDNNAAEDTGHLHVTYANNYFSNVSSRLPSIRFGTGHIFNNYYENVLSSAVDTRDGAQVLVESNVFVKAKKPVASLYSDDQGYAVVKDNDFGGEKNEAPAGTLTKVPYTYTALGSAKVKAAVVGTAGNTLKF